MTPRASASRRPQVPVVALGASAGGLAALEQFFRHLPPATGLAYVVIVHLSPDHESQMAELLQRSTAMKVTEVTAPTEVEPDHVYVIPPERNLSCAEGRLDVLPRPPSGHNRAPIDLFFRTLAETHGADAVGIVLSGTGSDGAQGLRLIKESGGIAMAQQPQDAAQEGMPRAAIRTGVVDVLRPAAELGPELVRLRGAAPALDGDEALPAPAGAAGGYPLGAIFDVLRQQTGRDLSAYRDSTVRRRLLRRMHIAAVESLGDYLELLRSDPEEARALDRDLLIAVTTFFRDAGSFAALESVLLPELPAHAGAAEALRVWVAGCATGEEAYSLAILLHELFQRVDTPPLYQVFATDIDDRSLRLAREALYPEGIAADVPEERLVRYFSREGAGYRVAKHVRERVLFARHDLLRDPPFSRLDLITCRNVLIYLQRETQTRVLRHFHYGLRRDGHLFLGGSECTDAADDLFVPVDREHRIFRRRTPLRERETTSRTDRARPLTSRTDPTLGGVVLADRPPEAGALAALHLHLLELHAPPSVVVDGTGEVLHLSPEAGRFLRLRGGEPSGRLLDLVDGDLKLELRGLLHAAFRDGQAVEGRPLPARIDTRPTAVRLSVRPLPAGDDAPRYALVVFAELPADVSPPVVARERSGESASALEALEAELESAREQLRIALEKHDRTIQDYQAANEELSSTNEEQAATAEELETSQEELQSLNEELRTVNQEYRSTIEEQAQLNADLRNLINSTDIATIFLDRDLAIRRFTPQVAQIFSCLDTDIGRPLSDLTHRLVYPELIDDAREVLRQLAPVEREVPAQDGRWFVARMLPYRSLDDRVGGVVITLVDISLRKSAELERERLLEESRLANAAKSNFLGVISHEFRTPLTAVIGYAEILAEGMAGKVDEKQVHHLLRIKAAAQQLLGMVQEILDHARLETGQETIEESIVVPATLVGEALDSVAPQAGSKGLELVAQIEADLPVLRTDAGKLRQILVNLLGNAVKFTEIGRVVVRGYTEGGHAVFEVEDTGIGIPAEHLDRIFERFWQVHSGATRIRGGTGLGLTVARQLARLLGGDVSVASEPGRGSRFTVRLPLGAPSDAVVPA
jgi:two-component system CheB/CheR fusion protein